MMKNYEGKIFLVTGGTGSFGSNMVSELLNLGAAEIRIFSRDEKKQEDLRHKINDQRARFFIGDVRSRGSINRAMTGVNYVFHAAALKQVPSCEFHPMEAIKTNILGAENVIETALHHKVDKVVFLSTDKAVYPVNAMGMSKALMEKLVISRSLDAAQVGTVMSCTRYGNVMYSRGSVIPHFISCIKNNVPLPITDPEMTRFLMTLKESVGLVLHAFENAKPGDIFVQKSPAARIDDLATAVLELFGSQLTKNTIGTRHGEKLFETLLSREELAASSETKRFFQISPDDRDLNYNKFFSEGSRSLSQLDDYNSHNTQRLGVPEIKKLLSTVPEVVEALCA